MLFPPDRKLARSRGLWPRIVAMVGLAAFSCTFPDYRFEDVATETCDNHVLDGDETGIDCGGDCDPCPACTDDEDCTGTDEVCEDGDCRGPCENGECFSCEDGERNGDETDEDCGGSCTADCAIGKQCNEGGDCQTKVCDETCQPPTCEDGEWNGTEAYTDCGRDCLYQCANGEPCLVGDDCVSSACVKGATGEFQCAPPFCKNGMRDPGETDTDCGGGDCPKCDDRESCGEDFDCISGVCGDDDTCAEPACNDGVENGDETDTDCGGDSKRCPRCEKDAHCDSGGDCISKICNDENECQEHSCDDGVLNGTESDEDCGGSCDGCAHGDRCTVDRDCALMICDRPSEGPGSCVSCDDEEQNGRELGIDCGGEDCDLCPPEHDCTGSLGCVNYLCDGGECVTGLAVDYVCGQCGEDASDHIKFFLTLRNLSNETIDVSDVTVRYYMSFEASESTIENFDLECLYQGVFSCGPQDLLPYTANPTAASYYIETLVGSPETIAPNGSAMLEVTLQLKGTSMDQRDDYSFFKENRLQQDWQRITLHRQGYLIWGNEP